MNSKSLLKGSAAAIGAALVCMLGCSSNNPASPNNNNDTVTQTVKSASGTSVKIYRNIASFTQMTEFIVGPNEIVDLEIPEVKNPGQAAAFANSIGKRALAKLSVARPGAEVQSANGDSVIWDVVFEEDGITYRSKLIYDDATGKARLFLIGFEFPEGHPLSYDSTEIRVDLNFTLFDDSDDILLALDVLKRYKPSQLIQEERGSFVPDSHPAGTEPSGGVLTSDIRYSNSSFISSTSARFEYHESGGSFSKESVFSDGSKSREAATFGEDGTGTFSELRRDGTRIEGEFDSGEEDGQGSYSLTTTFPNGHDPVSISESGVFSINAADSTLDGSFEREVTFQDGRTEVERVAVSQTRVGDVLTTTLNVENPNGSSGSITILETPDVDQVSGEWLNADGTFLLFSAESYTDGSAHLEFDLYASKSDFESGAEPIASGVFDFYPDGSGQGTVTEGDQTYEISVHPDGSETIRPRS